MIEEIVGFFLALVSLFTSDAPQLSRQNNGAESASMTEECEENDPLWQNKIHREYEREAGGEFSQQLLHYFASQNYGSVGRELRVAPSFRQSIQRSLQANLTIIVAAFPTGLLGITILYLDLNTADLCCEWSRHNNSIPLAVMRWKFIGEDIQAIVIFLISIPVTLILLFGWTDFKFNHIATLYIAFATGAIVVIYKAFTFVFGVYRTKDYYLYPPNVLFFVNLVWGNVLVSRKIHKVHPLISKLQIFIVLSSGFIPALSITYIYRYAIVPTFNRLENQICKILVAAIAPVVALLPTAICKRMTSHRNSAKIFPLERSYLLVYFLRGTTIFLYRIMQADFNSIWLFVGLSLFSGFSNVARKATRRIREKIWTRLVDLLKNTFCCRRLREIPNNTPHQRRMTADIEIQNMLFEYTTLIMSQVYLVLYLITNFEISVWPVLKDSLVRISIGLGIDFVFNCLSIFIQIHWFDIPIRRVWLKHWKRHTVANALVLSMIMCYFTFILLTVIHTRTDKSAEDYYIKNCTLPFTSLRERFHHA